MLLKTYFENLDYKNRPEFLEKYLKVPSLLRLKKVGYFCGMEHASKDIYDFKEYVTRYTHSVSTALLTWKLSQDKKMTLAALFHDIATPCFSHVIDYMNKDYAKQESTEEFTDEILKNDKYLIKCLEKDGIDIEDVINFKKYSIVDNDRPKICADRLDGIILTGISWTKNIRENQIRSILNDLTLSINEYGEKEISFKDRCVANFVLKESQNINSYCHSNEDNYMMELLAEITRHAINKEIITYEDLFYLDEEELFDILNTCNDCYIKRLLDTFYNIKKTEIPNINLPDLKPREIDPLINGKRLKEINIMDNYR